MKGNRVIVIEVTVLAVVVGVIVYSLILPPAVYHFQKLALNFYTDGSTDFTTDATVLVRNLGVVSLMSMVLGLVVGTTITLSSGIKLGSPSSASAEMGSAGEPASSRYDRLTKMGLLRKTLVSEEGTKYTVTEAGLDFLQGYGKFERDLPGQDSQRKMVPQQQP